MILKYTEKRTDRGKQNSFVGHKEHLYQGWKFLSPISYQRILENEIISQDEIQT